MQEYIEGSHIYQEGDKIESIFFVKKNKLAFFFPRYENKCFQKAVPGDIIGLEDYIYNDLVIKKNTGPLKPSYKFAEEEIDINNMGRRVFSVQVSNSHCIVNKFMVQDLQQLQWEFPEAANKLFWMEFASL